MSLAHVVLPECSSAFSSRQAGRIRWAGRHPARGAGFAHDEQPRVGRAARRWRQRQQQRHLRRTRRAEGRRPLRRARCGCEARADGAVGPHKSFFPGASAETTNTEAELVGAPGRKRTKKEDIHERVEYKGKTIDTIKGTSVVEDKEWVLILNKDQHGNKEYVCLRCNT